MGLDMYLIRKPRGTKIDSEELYEDVGYWRKANQIHNWFVNHVQDGIDDCDYHHEVTKELLEELLDTCETVYNSCSMMVGLVKNGETLVDGKWNYDGQCNPFQASTIDGIIKKLEAGETLDSKVVIMEEKGFSADTITAEDVETYGI